MAKLTSKTRPDSGPRDVHVTHSPISVDWSQLFLAILKRVCHIASLISALHAGERLHSSCRLFFPWLVSILRPSGNCPALHGDLCMQYRDSFSRKTAMGRDDLGLKRPSVSYQQTEWASSEHTAGTLCRLSITQGSATAEPRTRQRTERGLPYPFRLSVTDHHKLAPTNMPMR